MAAARSTSCSLRASTQSGVGMPAARQAFFMARRVGSWNFEVAPVNGTSSRSRVRTTSMPGVSWSAAPSQRLKKMSKPPSLTRRLTCLTDVSFSSVSTCHSSSGRNGRGSQGQSLSGKGTVSRSWLVSRQMRKGASLSTPDDRASLGDA